MPPRRPDRRPGAARAERGDFKGAIREVTKALKLDPDRADLLNDRGLARAAAGDLMGAMSDYAAALKVDPGFWPAHANRGALLAERGEYGGAIFEFSLGLRLNPRSAQLYRLRADSLGRVMDHDDALRDYTKAVRLDPKLGDAWFGRGCTYRLLATIADRPSLRHLQAARADFRKALELSSPGSGYMAGLPQLLREVQAELDRARSK